ncbi:MAG: DUF1579 family protein [Planctomycetes bacterium]|nr:DUF1579 family protein [Planctomycetota bacterium]
MAQLRRALFACPLVLFVLEAPAQDGVPAPAAELKVLAPLVGNWTGRGVLREPGDAETKWQAACSYRWVLDGHFLREDLRVGFEGTADRLLAFAYLGWDRENRRFVRLGVTNTGLAQLHTLRAGADGALTTLSLQRQHDQDYAERVALVVKGDTLRHTVDLLLPEGSSRAIVDGTFQRGGDAVEVGFGGAAFLGGAPHPDLARLVKTAGRYTTEGLFAMGPGQPTVKITGTDDFRSGFGGLVLHGHTEGTAEGLPGHYIGEVFWAYDEVRQCLVAHYLSNMGELMTMEGRWTKDGQLLATSHGLWNGEPMVQRMLMQFDDDGFPVGANSHSIVGTGAPYESFRATYRRQQPAKPH